MVRMDLEELKELKRGMEEDIQLVKNIYKGDVYMADLGAYQGNIQGGIRPVVITSNNSGNRHSEIITVLPFSTRLYKMKLPTHVFVERHECNLEKDSFIMAEQIRTINKKDLLGYIGHMDNEKVNKVIKISQGIEKAYSEKEEVLINKVKNLKELDVMISMMLDKSNNIITDFIKQFIDDRHNLLLDIKEYCDRNNMNLHYYYKKEEYIKIAI